MSTRALTGLTEVPQPNGRSFSRQGGRVLTVSREFAASNTAENDAYTWAESFVGRCESYDVTPTGGGCYKATVRLAGMVVNGSGGVEDGDPDEPLNDVWELQPNFVEKDILETDLPLITYTGAITVGGVGYNFFAMDGDDIKFVRQAGEDTSVEFNKPVTSAAGASDNMWLAISLIRAGVKSISIAAPVIRHTLIVREDYSVKNALTNCGKVIYDIEATESIPSTILFNLPDTTVQARADGISMTRGWLKKFPTVTQVAGGKWQITQEWEYGLWSKDLYTFV